VSAFPIAAVGASAGGVAALSTLLEACPPDPGLAFVVITHHGADHQGGLAPRLARASKIPVLPARDGMRVGVDRVYVVPPGKNPSISGGTLRLQHRGMVYAPIDHFMGSLARECPKRAIGVILSGEASDGTLGIQEIKARGGVTIAQDGATAMHPGMPRAAISTGAVDHILPPQAIAQRICQGPSRESRRLRSRRRAPSGDEVIKDIIAFLRASRGIDFTHYRPTTIKRRILGRMKDKGVSDWARYLAYLKTSPQEAQALCDAILVHVTNFFRDPRVFKALKTKAYPRLLERLSGKDAIRIWVPGCSTGEEAYSHAINLLEHLGDAPRRPRVQVFATDLSEMAVSKARAGFFPASIAQDVTPDRLRRFFLKVRDGYQIRPGIRDLCVFSRHDMAADPPFSNLDLISCRNVLIYLEPALRRKVLPAFHHALKKTGFLMLGQSEAVGEHPGLFTLADARASLYAPSPVRSPLPMAFAADRAAADSGAATERRRGPLGDCFVKGDFEDEVNRILFRQYVPAGVVVDGAMNIQRTHGHTRDFLELPQGKTSVNLFEMVRGDIAIQLRAAIEKARSTDASVKRSILVKRRRREAEIGIDVIPFRCRADRRRCYLVLFNPSPGAAAGTPAEVPGETPAGPRSRSAYEDIISSNEDLRSMNEELDTVKEELQSTNEELVTVNEELRQRNIELNTTNNDLSNLLSSSQIPILMLGCDLRIRHFTLPAEKAFNLSLSDMGRSILGVKLAISVPRLREMLRGVIDEGLMRGLEVQDRSGRWFDMWIRPYRTGQGKIGGAVLSLVDITEKKVRDLAVQEARDYAEAIIDTIKAGLLVLDARLKVVKVNRSFLETFALAPAKVQGQSILELSGGAWDAPGLRERLESAARKGEPFTDWEGDFELPGDGRRTMAVSGRIIPRGAGRGNNVLVVIENVSLRKQAAEAESLRKSEGRQRAFVANVSHELMTPITAIKGYSEALVSGGSASPAQRLKFAQIIEKNADRLTQLVEDIMELSNFESGRKKTTAEDIPLRTFIRKLVLSLTPLARKQAIAISVDVPSDLAVRIDRAQLAQVLQNLCENAIKYNRRKGRIVISARLEGKNAVVSIQDTGIGIAAKDLGRIFERFHRADNARVRVARGSGLGLSIVKTILGSHGCRIWTESVEGKGSTFSFTLPLSA
jgi:two-component system CheB/CheR fusion protein